MQQLLVLNRRIYLSIKSHFFIRWLFFTTKNTLFSYYYMIIIDPGNSTHTIYVIPRYYNIDNTHTLSIKDDDTKTTSTPSVTRALTNGYITYEFDLTTTEGKSYDIKIADNTTSNIVWRGKMFSTAQVTQNYKIHD